MGKDSVLFKGQHKLDCFPFFFFFLGGGSFKGENTWEDWEVGVLGVHEVTLSNNK